MIENQRECKWITQADCNTTECEKCLEFMGAHKKEIVLLLGSIDYAIAMSDARMGMALKEDKL